jgi:hypothetical protein
VSAWILRFRRSLQDLTPDQVALLVSVGLVLGVFPIMGCPTLLCLLAAGGLRLNAAALQLLNNFSSPLQLALLMPLARAGGWLCGGVEPLGGASIAGRLGAEAVHAIVGWTCICVPLGILLYIALVLVMRKGRASWFNSIKSPA